MADIPTGFEPIRDTLKNKYSVSEDRIGYDQGPDGNWVTIDNQKIFKDPTNIGGTTYAGQDVFGSAAGKINTLNNAYNLQQQVLNPAQTVNPYDQQVNDTLAQMLQKDQHPAAIDRYRAAQYAASQAASQRGAQQATRQAQEVLGDSGFSQSTRLSDRAQGIQNDANAYLETQVVPQIIQQLQGAQQQEIGNLSNILGLLQGQQGVFVTRQQNQQNRQFDVLDYVTGRSDRDQDIQRDDERITRETEYQAARDAILDERYKTEFDLDVERYGLEQAADKAYKAGMLSLDRARLGIQQDEAAARKTEAEARKLEEENLSAFETEIVGGITAFDNALEANEWLNENAAAITSEMGPEGLQELRSMIPSFFPAEQAPAKTLTPAELRQEAISMAQKDSDWGRSKDREALIQEYIKLIQGQ